MTVNSPPYTLNSARCAVGKMVKCCSLLCFGQNKFTPYAKYIPLVLRKDLFQQGNLPTSKCILLKTSQCVSWNLQPTFYHYSWNSLFPGTTISTCFKTMVFPELSSPYKLYLMGHFTIRILGIIYQGFFFYMFYCCCLISTSLM